MHKALWLSTKVKINESIQRKVWVWYKNKCFKGAKDNNIEVLNYSKKGSIKHGGSFVGWLDVDIHNIKDNRWGIVDCNGLNIMIVSLFKFLYLIKL